MPAPAADNPAAPAATVEPKSAFEAVQLELQGQITEPSPDPEPETPPADPKPGDELPPPDSAPKAPEGDGETDPSDNAPQDPAPKPDDKKTEVPTDPKADDPKVEAPGKQKDGDNTTPTKRPSDEYGTLDERVSERTRERFEKLKTGYDNVVAERDQARAVEQRWIETVRSTGSTPEQFGEVLTYLSLGNSSDPADQLKSFEMLERGYLAAAKKLGKPVAGVYDPLDDHPDLKERVADGLDRQTALELAQHRVRGNMTEQHRTSQQQAQQAQQFVDQQIGLVEQYAAEMRSKDPLFAMKQPQLVAYVQDIVAELPPEKWLSKIQSYYARIVVQQPEAPPPPPPVVNTGMRPAGGPGPGSASDPSNPLEAVQRQMGWAQ